MSPQLGIAQLGRLMHDHRWIVIGAWLTTAVCLKLIAPDWATVARDGDLEHLPADTAVMRGEELSRIAFPDEEAKSQIVLIFSRQDAPLTIEDREFALHLGNDLQAKPLLKIVDVWNERTPVIGASLRSRTGLAQRVVIRLTNEFMATDNIRVLQEVEEQIQIAAREAPEGLQIGISGSAAVGGDMLLAAAESVTNTHQTTIFLVAVTLILIYRSPRLVLIPLLTIGLAASISIDLLALLAHWSPEHSDFWPALRVFTTTKIFVVVLLFGSGTDYCLFLTSRFREQLRAGLNRRESVATAMQHVGMALIASAVTTILGLSMMGFAQFGKFAHGGPSIAMCLAVTLLACLSLVPALLSTRLGNVLERGAVTSRVHFWHLVWDRVARFVQFAPGTILALSLVIALPLAWRGWSVEVTYDFLGELSSDRVSRRGTEMLKRHFPPGEIGPLVVLAEHPEGELDTMDGQFKIAELAKRFDDLPGVAQVRSLYQPMGDPPGTSRVFTGSGLEALAARGSPLTQAAFVSQQAPHQGRVTRLFLILADQPFSEAAVATCNQIEQLLKDLRQDPESDWQQARFELTGPTVGIRDLERVTSADRKRIEFLVICAVLFAMMVLLRKPIICCYLIATVLLSFLVTMGISDWVFQSLRGEHYVGLDWKVPLFLFVILVAVGQDYNIYLVSRVLEEQRHHGLQAGLRRAIVQTGGIITSCGVIMAGTFVSMTTSRLNGMIELGFALTLGILLDTFVVRTILVPAFLAKLAGKSPSK